MSSGIISNLNFLDNFTKNGTKTVDPGIMKKVFQHPLFLAHHKIEVLILSLLFLKALPSFKYLTTK